MAPPTNSALDYSDFGLLMIDDVMAHYSNPAPGGSPACEHDATKPLPNTTDWYWICSKCTLLNTGTTGHPFRYGNCRKCFRERGRECKILWENDTKVKDTKAKVNPLLKYDQI
ncbi:uncharacterized protein PAC_04585 [Phialocephala subalpina]|uniref:Uncharacterized protein n=1 Tax=Phialocephala subalpina TaxID=576137 RepID=A0A1L7WPP3_9HELO|nr:uncharacterized protein PAC_04585 [Phialocephala subalpina]